MVPKLKNALERYNNVKEKLNYATINKALNKFRLCLAHYLKDYYKLNRLGKICGSNISMDNSNFVKIKEVKIRVIGARNNKTGNIRVDLYKTRNEK